MNIKINNIEAILEVSETGLWKLAIPSKGMFISERSESLDNDHLEKAKDKLINRAKGLLWTFPIKRIDY